MIVFLEKQIAVHEFEAKSLRRLADELRRRFPLTTVIENTTPVHPDLDALNVSKLNNALMSKRGRVRHVAARLKTSEALIRELLSKPESKFRVAQRGWIVAKN